MCVRDFTFCSLVALMLKERKRPLLCTRKHIADSLSLTIIREKKWTQPRCSIESKFKLNQVFEHGSEERSKHRDQRKSYRSGNRAKQRLEYGSDQCNGHILEKMCRLTQFLSSSNSLASVNLSRVPATFPRSFRRSPVSQERVLSRGFFYCATFSVSFRETEGTQCNFLGDPVPLFALISRLREAYARVSFLY